MCGVCVRVSAQFVDVKQAQQFFAFFYDETRSPLLRGYETRRSGEARLVADLKEVC